jgi:hypothetical protein
LSHKIYVSYKNFKEKEMFKEKQDAYEVPALVITPEKPIAVTGNFEDVEKTLTRWAAKVGKMTDLPP